MPVSFDLPLDHGVTWALEAFGAAEGWLEGLARAMGLSAGSGGAERRIVFEIMPGRPGEFFGPRLTRCARGLQAREWKVREFPDLAFFAHPALSEIIGEIAPGVDGPVQVQQMRRALLPVYADTLLSGGLPVHGALVEIDGAGVILAGRSGAGKSTACRRLPAPWEVLGDDLCLVVKDVSGNYRAHPLPTWSAFRGNGGSGSCRAGFSVPLRAVFYLEQSPADEYLQLKKSTVAISLAGSAVEVFRSIDFRFPGREEPAVKKALYENAAAIAAAIPAFLLRLSLTGSFWEQMEEARKGNAPPVKSRKSGDSEQRGAAAGLTGRMQHKLLNC